jgi:hypothetical protein
MRSVITPEQLEAVALPAETSSVASVASVATRTTAFDPDAWLREHCAGLGVDGPHDYAKEGFRRRWKLKVCPMDPSHKRTACVVQRVDGTMGASCQHKTCVWGWGDLRAKYEPDYAARKNGNGTSVANVASVAASIPATQEADAPVRVDRQWPDPPHEAVYLGLAGDFVKTIEPHSESDPLAILLQFLVAYGNVIGRDAHYVVEATHHYMNLFLNLVGETSKGRKGTSYGHVERAFRANDPEWRQERGLSSGEGLIWAVRDAIEKMEKVGRGKDQHYEMRVVDPGVEDKRLLICQSEFASVLKVLTRDGNTLSSTIRDAWDSGNLSALVKNSQTRATGAHISIVGHVTRDELLRYLEDTEYSNGFGNRFLWACVRRSKLLPDGGDLDRVDFARLYARLRSAVDFAKAKGRMKRDSFAAALWHSAYPQLTADKQGLLGSLTARAEAQVLRLSCIYALLDQSLTIRAKHLCAALAVWDYCDRSALYIFGDASGDPVADTILRVLRSTLDGLTRTAIRDLLGRHEKENRIAQALAKLAEAGKARCVKIDTGGRPAETWFATIGGATKATNATEGPTLRELIEKYWGCDQSDESDHSSPAAEPSAAVRSGANPCPDCDQDRAVGACTCDVPF